MVDFLKNEIADKIHAANIANGFYENQNLHSFKYHQIFEIIKEIGEASEAHKKNKFYHGTYSDFENGAFDKVSFETNIKDTFEDELADTYIRVLDFSAWMKFDLNNAACIFTPFTTEPSFYSFSFYALEMIELAVTLKLKRVSNDSTCLKVLFMLESIAESHSFDLQKHIELKLKYNATRGKLHGKSY